ncbi:hypothetical protein GTP45_08710 [Pseudoduganella sp. FT55W]|uniref:DUF7738 domain-containing protein n=1 Tax=Duganella rivi TaxID=2666083 RepID=A0A7X4KC09_9BURK|nr:hypothetical protein [Duganella rivi]MYM66908.1 hypothetical protein [Duganella rivi]
MIKKIVTLLLLSGTVVCHAQNGSAPSLGERLNSVFEQVAKKAGLVKDYGTPRKVNRGARPEIILKDNTITWNGKPLALGQSIEEWRKVIGKGAVCSARNERPGWCKWDALGIEIAGSIGKPNQVGTFNVNFNRAADEGLYDLRARDAAGKPIDPVWLSKGVFPGYLEFDGFGIDKLTKFWEVRASVDRQHDLRCGLRDCSHPLGAFGESAAIYMILMSNDEYGVIKEFAIANDSTHQ